MVGGLNLCRDDRAASSGGESRRGLCPLTASGGRHVRRIRCSGSKLVYQAAALDAVHQCSPMSKSLVTARIRSPGRTLKPAAEVRGGMGLQVQILSSRSEAAVGPRLSRDSSRCLFPVSGALTTAEDGGTQMMVREPRSESSKVGRVRCGASGLSSSTPWPSSRFRGDCGVLFCTLRRPRHW
jgi:hypothetical protein